MCGDFEEISNPLFEIGADKDHIHLLIQSVPKYSLTQIVGIVKSITTKRVFMECPQVKKSLWGGEFWSDDFYVSTVSEHGNEKVITNYERTKGMSTTSSIKKIMLKDR